MSSSLSSNVLSRLAGCICLVLVLFLPSLNFADLSSGTSGIAGPHSNVSRRSNGVPEVAAINPRHKIRRLLGTGKCTNKDISISQSPDSSSGIPQYIVQIVNTCMPGCAPSDIHLHCGWFASAKVVNPNIFRRTVYDDCLVNGGKPLKPSQIIRFTYKNSFMYPLSFKSAKFC